MLFLNVVAVIVAVVTSWNSILWLEAEPNVNGGDATDSWPRAKKLIQKYRERQQIASRTFETVLLFFFWTSLFSVHVRADMFFINV